MARVPAVLALVAFAGEQKLLAQRAEDGLVELPLDEFVAVHLEDVPLALAHGALTAKTARSGLEGPLANILLDWGAILSRQSWLRVPTSQAKRTEIDM